MTLTITPLSDALGAEVRGVDVSSPIDDRIFGAILEAFHDSSLLCLRAQSLTPEQHIAFSRKFGDLEIHVSKQYLLPGHPEILVLSNERNPDGSRVSIADGGAGWHSDLSYMARPSLGSLLYAVRLPDTGGDTEWTNQYTAYETLPEKTKLRIEGLRAIHQFGQEFNPRTPSPNPLYRDTHSAEVKSRTPDVAHPIVRTHPVTGRKSLFTSLTFTIGIAGLDKNEGDALLDELLAHQDRPEFVYHHKWREGDLMIWDNRCTNHRADGGVVELPQVRRLHRTTVSGDAPF